MSNLKKSFQVDHETGFFSITAHEGCIEIKDILVEGQWGEGKEKHKLMDKLLIDYNQINDIISALNSFKKKSKKGRK